MSTLTRTTKHLAGYLFGLMLLGAAITHIGLLVTGLASFAGWYWPILGYGIMLALAFACYALKPEDARRLAWLAWHFLVPPGLLGIGSFSAVAGQLLNDLAGEVTLAGDFLVQAVEPVFLAVTCAVIALLASLALLEIVLRGVIWLLNREMGEDEERPSLFEPVFEFFNELWLTPIRAWVSKIDTLEIWYCPSKAIVADEVGKVMFTAYRRSITGMTFMLLLGGAATLGLTVFPPLVAFVNHGDFGSVRFAWPVLVMFTFMALVSAGALGPGTVLWQYLISEWNRRHHRIISFRDVLFNVWIRGPGGTPFKSQSLTARMTSEAKTGSAGEAVAERESLTLWGQIWDGMFLWSGKGFLILCNLLNIELWQPPWKHVGMCWYPTTAVGGADSISHVDYADTTQAIHTQIGALSQSVLGIRTFHFGKVVGEAMMDLEGAEVSIFDGGPDVYETVDAAKALFFQRMAEMTGYDEQELQTGIVERGEILDLMGDLPEVDRWHRPSGTKLWQAQI